MTEEEKNVFDGVDMPEEDVKESKQDSDNVEFEKKELSNSKGNNYTHIVFEEDREYIKDKDGAISKIAVKGEFEIEKVEIGEPKTTDAEGNFIPPTPFNTAKPDQKGYKVKLHVYYKDSDYVSYLPSCRWYVGVDKESGKKVLSPWIDTRIDETNAKSERKSVVSKLYFKYCKSFDCEGIGAADFITGLVGKKVKLEQWADVYLGKDVFRIDIDEFLK